MRILKIIATILIPLQFGLLGSFATADAVRSEWFADLVKPSFYPPGWLFGPVWTILYILMGISLWLVWRDQGINRSNRLGIIIFFIQLLLNCLWSYIFFAWKNPFYALLEMAILWIFIVLNSFLFYKISRPAAWLLISYILWVSFAFALNYFIVIHN